jgi:hypothetical protein
MEVHAHTHTPRKKWTHYFWEFLMLFLAVTLGFFVENQREHYVEHQRAKIFAESLVEDLQTDTSEIHLSSINIDSFLIVTDIFFAELNKPRSLQSDSILQVIGAKYIYEFNFFDATMGNYEQVKNSGALRYFKQYLVKKFTVYETGAKKLTQEKQNYIEILNNVIIPFCVKVANADFLRSIKEGSAYTGTSIFVSEPGKETLNEWKNYIQVLRQKQSAHKWAIERHRKRALELLAELKKEYHLK